MAITEEQRYWLERDFVADLLKQLPFHIFWKNKDFIYLGCNDIFARSAGFDSPEEIVGKTDYDLHTTREESDAYRTDDMLVMRSKLPKMNIEETQTLPDGRKIILLTSKVPLLDKKGEIIGVLGIYTDITERKKMELELKSARDKAEASSRAKSAFISSMSHDVRTPLSGVIAMADLLEKQGDTEKDRAFAHIIHMSSERLLQLLNDILDVFSADEIMDESLRFVTFSLQDRLEHIKDLISSNAQIEHIELNIYVDPDLPAYVVSDRIKIDRILLNLASNALKFTQEGSVNIALRLISNDGENLVVELTIRDTGIGIAKDQIEKIFECFYRVNPSYSNKYKGSGIGLFIVQKYVSLLGGEIAVNSELGEGSTFKIKLPMKIGREEDFKIDENEDDEMTNTFKGGEIKKFDPDLLKLTPPHNQKPKVVLDQTLRALVIEDDAVARRVVKSFFEMAGFDIDDVENADDAFRLVVNNAYDLIITDIGLIGMDGNQFTALVRTWEKATQRSPIPIIGLSAHGDNQKEESLAAGMNILLTKPINEAKIKNIIKQFFSNQHEIASSENGGTKEELGFFFDPKNDETALFQLDRFSLYDEKNALERAGGDKAMVNELLQLLIKETIPEELTILEELHKSSDWESIKQVAHKLKGAALYCGTTRMYYACEYMENYVLANKNKLLEDLYQQLLQVTRKTRDHLITFV